MISVYFNFGLILCSGLQTFFTVMWSRDATSGCNLFVFIQDITYSGIKKAFLGNFNVIYVTDGAIDGMNCRIVLKFNAVSGEMYACGLCVESSAVYFVDN